MSIFTKIRLYIKHYFEILKMDAIDFNVIRERDDKVDPEGWEWLHTDMLINGKSLFDKLYEYEYGEARRTKTNTNLAGKYVGIDPYHLIKGLKRKYRNEFSAWQCSICRSRCTTHLVCEYKVTPLFVELYNFRQLANPILFDNSGECHPETLEKYKWNYEAFGPFRFNRFIFFKKLKALKETQKSA